MIEVRDIVSTLTGFTTTTEVSEYRSIIRDLGAIEKPFNETSADSLIDFDEGYQYTIPIEYECYNQIEILGQKGFLIQAGCIMVFKRKLFKSVAKNLYQDISLQLSKIYNNPGSVFPTDIDIIGNTLMYQNIFTVCYLMQGKIPMSGQELLSLKVGNKQFFMLHRD